MANRRGHLGVAWAVNGLLTVMLLEAAILSDGNGRLPHKYPPAAKLCLWARAGSGEIPADRSGEQARR